MENDKIKEHIAEAKDYLYNSLTLLQQQQLSTWIEQLILYGKPKDNSWVGIEIKLFPGTMLGLSNAAIQLLERGCGDKPPL